MKLKKLNCNQPNNIMKKALLYTVAVMLTASLALTACRHRQEQEQEPTQQVKRQVQVTYKVKCSQDVMDAINFVVIYKDKGGINATDTVRDSVWTKTVVSDVVPFKVGLRWALSAKPVSQIAKDSLQLRAKYAIECKDCPIQHEEKFMFNHSNFPASKLAGLCDYETMQHDSYWDGPYGCKMIVFNPDASHDWMPDLMTTLVPWDDK